MDDIKTQQLKAAIHDINNALNLISIQTELALMHSQSGKSALAESALNAVLDECRKCSEISRSTHAIIKA